MLGLENLKVIQTGFPKSGNSMLYKLLTLCLKELGIFKSYKNTVGMSYIYKNLYKMHKLEELFENYLSVDDIRVIDGKVYLSFLFPVQELRLVEIDPKILLNFSSLVWSHSKISELYPLFLNFGIRFYIIRDGRDTINSLIHANTTLRVLKHYPEFKINEAEELYKRLDIFKKYVRMWKEHIDSFSSYRDFFTEIRYENLIEVVKIFSEY